MEISGRCIFKSDKKVRFKEKKKSRYSSVPSPKCLHQQGPNLYFDEGWTRDTIINS